MKPPARRRGYAEADFHHQPRRVRRHGAHVQAERVLDEAEASFAGQRHRALLAIGVQDLLGGMADQQGQLMLDGAAIVAVLT